MVTDTLGFVPLPPLYWLYLAIMLLGYALLTQVVKTKRLTFVELTFPM